MTHGDERYIDGINTLSEQDPGADDLPVADAYIENDDGSVTFADPEFPTPAAQGFQDNLAESLPSAEANAIVLDLLERIDYDKQARDKRDKQYEEGIRRAGVSGDDTEGGATFDGASKVVHPVLAEVSVDFAASAIKELFPPSGPVRTKLRGKETEDKRARAERKAEFLNWQLTSQIVEYRDNLEQRLSQVPLGGSQFQKFYYDERLGRPAESFVPIDEIYLPYHAANIYSASRVTHRYPIDRVTFENRIESGLYLDINLPDPMQMEQSASAQASDKVEGKTEDVAYDNDGNRYLLEIYCYRKIEGDSISKTRWAPYIITIDEHSERLLAIYRNWEEQDPRMKKLDWLVEWGFIPWRGAYKIGLFHLIGSLSIAATGSLRALLDSAHINNVASAVKLRGGRTSGQNLNIEVTEVQELDAPAGVDDIRKLIMPMPFNPPSPVLFQLLGWLTDAAKGVASTATEKIGEATNQMPVGTAMALIEQGSKVYSAIHARLHASQERALRILCRINKNNPPSQELQLQEFGELLVQPDDFERNDDVQPVSDPNIFSETQRYARWQAVMQMTQDQSVPWNKQEIYRDGLKLLKIDDADRYLPAKPQPITADPVQENIGAVLQGAQLKAQQQQDHLAHLHEHLRFLVEPTQGGSPVFSGQQLQPVLQHCMEHLMMLYDVTSHAAAQAMASMGMQGSPDTLAAEGAESASKANAENLAPLLQMLQQAQQSVQSRMPPQPMDPTQATLQAAMAETKRRADADQMGHQEAMAKLDADGKKTLQTMQQQESDFVRTLQMDMKQQRDALMIELAKLQQGQQELQLEAEKQAADRDQRFHDMLAQLAERSATAETPTVAPEPPAFDPAPHLDRIQQMMEQQRNDQHGQAMAAALQGIQQLLQQGNQRPNKVVRDQNGDAMGMVYDPTFGQTVQ